MRQDGSRNFCKLDMDLVKSLTLLKKVYDFQITFSVSQTDYNRIIYHKYIQYFFLVLHFEQKGNVGMDLKQGTWVMKINSTSFLKIY